MSAAEVEQRLTAIHDSIGGQPQGVDQQPGELLEELRQLAASDDGNEVYMVNLINYRAKALYPTGSNYNDNAMAADTRYNKALIPFLLKHGGEPLFVGDPMGRFIDKAGDTHWQRTAIVRYRSRRDLLKMAADVAPQGVAIHK
jgi:hypothetical protein